MSRRSVTRVVAASKLVLFSSALAWILLDAPTAPAGRVWDLDEAVAFARAEGFAAEAVRDFDAALASSARGAGTRVVTGSFHTVGDAMARLQVDPLAG